MTGYIDRKEAIEAIESLPNCYNGFSDTYDKACIIGILEELPAAHIQIQTNADCIRAMTDEELAECLYDITDNGYSADQWLEWLKKEVEE